MKRKILNYIAPALVCLAAAGCTADKTPPAGEDGANAITLKGLGTRAGTQADLPVSLVAFNSGDTTKRYFEPTVIYATNELNDNAPENLTFYSGTKYYPLGQREIDLIAYTGTLQGNHLMEVTAGYGKNDYILSNYGKRKTDSDVNEAYQDTGTPGSSDDPAEILQFRHVMTQLEIVIEVDETESNFVDPAPENVEFRIEGLASTGLYSLRAKSPESSIADSEPVRTAEGSGQYTVVYKDENGVITNINYLVPTGMNLVGQKFSHLQIDDYEATAADRAAFEIKGTLNEPDMPLYPGYAYKLTLKIQKLRLVGVEIEQVPWAQKSVNGNNPTYDPNRLALDITNGYINSGNDKVTKLVLHSASGLQYVGDADKADDIINFVTLPQEPLDSVEVYTMRGKLLTMPASLLTYNYAANSLSFPLSEVGMLLENPSAPNSSTNRYLVTTVAQLINIDKDLYGYYLQVDDIELEDPGNYAIDFTGFGEFHGRYEGNGHWIGNANFAASGLFAANYGELINIRIYTGNMDLSPGTTYAGSICAENYGLIYACLNEASLFDAPATVGGICGLNGAGGRVIACVNTGNIRSGITQGGICGENLNTDPKAFAACINIGNLWETDNNTAGAILGRSTDSPNTVLSTCFWLVGTAQVTPGEPEEAVGEGDVEMYDTTDLDPVKMRNGLDDGELDPQDRVLFRLNNEILGISGLPAGYMFVYNEVVTGITWPMAYNQNQVIP